MEPIEIFRKHISNLKTTGNNGQYIGSCPFPGHKNSDIHPSFSVNDSGLWICHAGCGKGNAYQFALAMKEDHTPFINRNFGSVINNILTISQTPKNGKSTKDEGQDVDINIRKQALAHNKYLLDHEVKLLRNLPWKNIVVKKLLVGFSDELRRLIFPQLDEEDIVLNLKFHKSFDGKPPYSIRGRGQCRLYPLNLLKEYDPNDILIFCEGEKDCVTLISNGYNAVTSTTGAGSIPKDLSPLAKFKHIKYLFDNDTSGIEGSEEFAMDLKQQFSSKKVDVVSWPKRFPDKYDITDFFNNEDPAEFEEILSNSKEVFSKEKTIENKSYSEDVTKRTIDFPLTDSGNAELLNHLFCNQAKFNHTTKKWFIWNGQYWANDKTSLITQFAIKAARQRQKDSISITEIEKKTKSINYGIRSENQNMISSSVIIAKSIPGFVSTAEDWNQNDLLFQLTNGVIELHSNKFRNGNPTDMISNCAGIAYDPNADCPLWKKTILEIMAGDESMVQFIQRSIGYTLSGATSEQCFFLLYGAGGNGKSLMLELLRHLLGDYAKDSPFTAFERRSVGNSQSNDLARLRSARLVTSAESGVTKRLDEERLKAITGGDPITCRFLYQEHFSYHPKFKLWLAVNSLPRTEDFSDGFWRRVRVIPFEVKFEGSQRDKKLIDKLKSEMEGVLNWAIEGFLAWQNIGLKPHDKVIKATKEYQTESDVVAEFIDGHIKKVTGIANTIYASDLYQNFCGWFEKEYSSKPINQTLFGKRTSSVLGFKSEKIGGRKVYIGIKYNC